MLAKPVSPTASETRLAWSGAMILGAGALFAQKMTAALAMSWSGICTSHPAFSPHCPACYAALGLVAAAVALALSGSGGWRSAARSRR